MSVLPLNAAVPQVTDPDRKKKSSRPQIDVNVDELDRIIDDAMRPPLNETDGRTLKTAIHAMAERLVRQRNTEKTSVVPGANARLRDCTGTTLREGLRTGGSRT